jgi:hypothetical protein
MIVIVVAWMKRSVIREFQAALKSTGLTEYIHVFCASGQRYEIYPVIRITGWTSAIQICSVQI